MNKTIIFCMFNLLRGVKLTMFKLNSPDIFSFLFAADKRGHTFAYFLHYKGDKNCKEPYKTK